MEPYVIKAIAALGNLLSDHGYWINRTQISNWESEEKRDKTALKEAMISICKHVSK